MKLGKWEKIALISAIAIFMLGIAMNIKSFFNAQASTKLMAKLRRTDRLVHTVTLSKNIKESAKKYDGYQELFENKTPVLIYGYSTKFTTGAEGYDFHTKVTKGIAEIKNTKFKVMPYANWNKKFKELYTKNERSPETCTMDGKKDDFESFTELISYCMDMSCIIDMKHNQAIIMNKNPELVLKKLKQLK